MHEEDSAECGDASHDEDEVLEAEREEHEDAGDVDKREPVAEDEPGEGDEDDEPESIEAVVRALFGERAFRGKAESDTVDEQPAAHDEHDGSSDDGDGDNETGDDAVGDEPAADAPDESPHEDPAPDLATVFRLRRRKLTQQLSAGVAALTVIVSAWAGMSSSSPHNVVSIADSTSPSPSVQSEALLAPKTLTQNITSSITLPGSSSLAWPSRGQAAVNILGMGSLGTYGSTNTPVPIASVTKTMVAYVVLADHPLSAGEPGPTIIVSPAEAAAYPAERALGQSLVTVKAGERLTERQALEALMLASADNVAKILARWDAGSVSAFVSEMNSTADRLGMSHTRYTDPSGYSPSTVSTATDQVILGQAAMRISALSQIVSESSATVPVQGTIGNYNTLLGQDGVDGIKTGSTDQAGGCLLFSATFTVGGHSETVIGAVLGQYLTSGSGFLDNTMYVARKLIASAQAALVSATIAVPGRQVAVIRQDGSPDTLLGVTSTVSVIGLAGTTYQVSVSGDPSAATLTVTVTASGGSSVVTSAPLTPIPSTAPKRPGPTTDARLSAPDPFPTDSPTSDTGPA